jgi:hypothetical protein
MFALTRFECQIAGGAALLGGSETVRQQTSLSVRLTL